MTRRGCIVAVLALPAVSCGGAAGSTARPTCPSGQTSLDGTCVTQQIADYVGCIRATGATVASDNAKSLSAAAGMAGATASTQAEVKDKLEKRYATVSDANALEIIRQCNTKTTGGSTAPTSSGSSEPTGPIADSIREFSGMQGQGGWTYGYSTPAVPFQKMTQFDGVRWTVDKDSYWTTIDAETAHPNGMQAGSPKKREEHAAIRRWTSTASGSVLVSVRFSHPGACGNGVDARLVVDGTARWSQYLPASGPEVTQTVPVTVHVGSTVDLVLDAHDKDDYCDGSKLSALITR